MQAMIVDEVNKLEEVANGAFLNVLFFHISTQVEYSWHGEK